MSDPSTVTPRRSSSRLWARIATFAAAAAAAACLAGSAASPASAESVDPCWIWGTPMKLGSYMGCQYYRPFTHAWVQITPYGYGWSDCYLRFWMGSSWSSWTYQHNWYVCNRRQN